MAVSSRVMERVLSLPPARTRKVVIRRDLEVPMPDGTVLLADHYAPSGGHGGAPTVLVRTPYGRWGNAMLGRLFAERGYQLLVQYVRGTGGSGGVLDPLRQEEADGMATLDWIERQPWFDGRLGTYGTSYLGFVQLVIGAWAGSRIQAMSVVTAPSSRRETAYPGGAFALQLLLSWTATQELLGKPAPVLLWGMLWAGRRRRRGFATLPLGAADRVVIGTHVSYFQQWLEHEAADPYWEREPVHSGGSGGPDDSGGSAGPVGDITAPVHLLGGWYDLFLPQTVRDYAELRDAGRAPQLTVGPWAHTSGEHFGVGLRETFAWFDAHLGGDRARLRDLPVRVWVGGAGQWRDYPDYPPPGTRQCRWYLRGGGDLATEPPEEPVREPVADRYRYDPADPTPSVGGATFVRDARRDAAAQDNRKLEARPDVLVYTSAPLAEGIEAIGPVRAELHVASTLAHTDFFARVCDVHPAGASMNITDAIFRVTPGNPDPEPDGTRRLDFELWPVAHRFAAGHRIRVQVSSGAHPRFARNTGTGEPLATATTLVPADQSVYHDPARPSAVVLTILGH